MLSAQARLSMRAVVGCKKMKKQIAVFALIVAGVSACSRQERISTGGRPAIQRVSTAIDIFEVEHGCLPTNLTQLLSGARGGPFLHDTNSASAFLDEWQTALRYTRSRESYELRSAGPDRQFETGDDLVVK